MKRQLRVGFDENWKFTRKAKRRDGNFDADNRIEEDKLEENQSIPEKTVKNANSSISLQLASEFNS